MGKISIQDLSSVLVDKRGLSKKEASNFISEMFDIVQQELEKEKLVKIKGLGTFKIIDVDDRESVNVNTGERVLIEGHGKITFTPDSLMKELVNKPFSQFETVVLNDGVEFEEEPSEEVSESRETDGDPSTMALVDFGLGNVKADLSSFPVIEDNIKKDDEIAEEPAVEGPVVKEPVAEKPVVKEPVVDEIAEEEPVADKPVAKEPAEEPTAEKPAAEEPTAEEPVEEEPAAEESAPDEIEDEDVVYDDEEETSGSKPWLWALIGCVVGLACGYLLGNYFPFGASPQTPEAPQQEKVAPAKPAAEQKENIVSIDSLETVEEPAKEAPKTESAKPAADATEALSAKYAEKDARVRLGAYHIVGTEKVVKAKEGQTLKQISRTYLGPDMECYMEVYNDMKANDVLKAGQEVKIPKLVWKKAARAKAK